ncbi:hypothetical protein [Sporosarcina sp. E16_8]|uniref:hypothetical protein n=1 Tax=Sporosarcina sp. E16_8 TaxID=2789295 RepID=UPI001A90F026|nr:hypothetical protein [Sporosarcina sp. E16_8]MBO0589199.1 hypothetical protein [Sporosarcina sp. E16_8]
MVTIEFQHAVGRVYLAGGLTEAGKIIRNSKIYRNMRITLLQTACPTHLSNLPIYHNGHSFGQRK